MINTNIVVIAGNLTRDPELKYTPSGAALCTLGLANNEQWRDANGELQKRTTFVDVVAWGKTAENVAQYLKKGAHVLVEGSLQFETWQTQSGDKRTALKVRAQRVQFGDQRRQDGEDAHESATTAPDGKRLF